MIYLTVSVTLNVFDSGWLGIVDPHALLHPVPPVIPSGNVTVHVKLVPITEDVNATGDVEVPEQICCVSGLQIVFGIGLTVTEIVEVSPSHPLACATTLYVTIPSVVPVLINV